VGAFFTNLQVRATDAAAVAAALESILTSGLAWVSPSTNGWVGVYPESTEKQEAREMESLATALSTSLGTHVLGILLHDSDVLHLWACSGGALVDEYDSDPDYFGKATKADRERLKGRPDVLARLGPRGTSPEAVADALAGQSRTPAANEAQLADMKERLLSKLAEMKKTQPKLARQFEGQVEAMLAKLAVSAEPAFAEGRLEALAEVMGIPAAHALSGFNDIEAGEHEITDLVLLPEARAAKRRARHEVEARQRDTRRQTQRAQGELLWTYEHARGRGREPLLRTLGFAADGRFWLAETPKRGGPESLVLLDAAGAEVARHPHEGLLWTSMSPDGLWLATITGMKRPIVLRRTADLAVAVELPPVPRGVGAVHLSPDGAFAAVDDFDGSLTVYRVASGALVRKIDIRGTNVRCCGWSADGRRLARIVGGDVVTSPLSPDENDTVVRVSGHGIRAFAVSYISEAGRLLVAGDGGAAIFTPDGEVERRLPWTLAGAERDAAFDRMAHSLRSKTTAAALAQSQPQLAQSGRAVAATPRWHAVLGADGTLRFWSAKTGEALGARDTQQGLLWELFVAQDGQTVVTGGNPVLAWRAP
jgi:hypothetical protein